MTYSDEDLRIAAGWNVAYLDLTLITSITPSTGDPFAPPKTLPLYTGGLVKPQPGGGLYESGYAAQQWMWTRWSYPQYSYFRQTYCNGGLSGKVTIYTTLYTTIGTVFNYYRMNAYAQIKQAVDISSEYRYKNVIVEFTRLVAAS